MMKLPDNYYPIPEELAYKMAQKAFKKYEPGDTAYILEPSAGTGDMIKGIEKFSDRLHPYCCRYDVDCIEINPELAAILKERYCEYGEERVRVVYDDFLAFKADKVYTHILMNPPFDEGEKHLLKALDILKNGGTVVCLLNAETLRNPYTNTRKELADRLLVLGADIEYIEHAFSEAERPTDVEIAMITVTIEPKTYTSFFFDDMKNYKDEDEPVDDNVTDIIEGSGTIRAAILSYRNELILGKRFIREYYGLRKYIPVNFCGSDVGELEKEMANKPIIDVKIGDKDAAKNTYPEIFNAFLAALRDKYWSQFFKNKELTDKFTSNLIKSFSSQVDKLRNYDFNEHNIAEIRNQMIKQLAKGVEDAVIGLFDKLSAQHSWFPESDKNIHYYNGWASNKAHKINDKVVLPTESRYGGSSWIYTDNWRNEAFDVYAAYEMLSNIEKVCSYFCVEGKSYLDLSTQLSIASRRMITKNIECRYFDITIYKKGTVHIKFTSKEALEALNIYGSKMKGWLPPSYGKKHYKDMNEDERIVIDAFQGEEAYEKELADPKGVIGAGNGAIALLS